jgi:hypothetical protein
VEREHLAGVVVDVGIGAGERAVARHLAGQPVDAAVVVGAAAAVVRVSVVRIRGVVDTAGGIGERTEVIVKRIIFLHHHNDVLQILQRGVSLVC